MSQSNAAELVRSESSDPAEVLERMLELSGQALGCLVEGDGEGMQTSLEEWERLARHAQPLLARHQITERSTSEDGALSSPASRAILDTVLRLQVANEQLMAAVAQRSVELARDLKLIDESPMVLDAYGKSDARSLRKIDLFR